MIGEKNIHIRSNRDNFLYFPHKDICCDKRNSQNSSDEGSETYVFVEK